MLAGTFRQSEEGSPHRVCCPRKARKDARTGKKPRPEHIAGRVEKVDGKTLAEARDGPATSTKPDGKHCIYKRSDAKYDVACGLLKAPRTQARG